MFLFLKIGIRELREVEEVEEIVIPARQIYKIEEIVNSLKKTFLKKDLKLEKSHSRKKCQNIDMIPQKKLFLICKYYRHLGKYKLWNNVAFWEIIEKLLKKYTKYDILKPKTTIMYWVKGRINKLIEEEISLSIQVKHDDFKAVIKRFAIWFNIV